MILGSTYTDRDEAKQARLLRLKQPHPWFAWHPVQLNDGRYAWLRWVVRDLNISPITYHSKRLQMGRWVTYTLENPNV